MKRIEDTCVPTGIEPLERGALADVSGGFAFLAPLIATGLQAGLGVASQAIASKSQEKMQKRQLEHERQMLAGGVGPTAQPGADPAVDDGGGCGVSVTVNGTAIQVA